MAKWHLSGQSGVDCEEIKPLAIPLLSYACLANRSISQSVSWSVSQQKILLNENF